MQELALKEETEEDHLITIYKLKKTSTLICYTHNSFFGTMKILMEIAKNI